MVDRGAGRLQLDGYVAELEAVWLAFEELYGSLPPEGWGRRYGKHWTFADQPFHLAYFDRVMVAEPLEAGRTCPRVSAGPCAACATSTSGTHASSPSGRRG
jgi:hypothetical protein